MFCKTGSKPRICVGKSCNFVHIPDTCPYYAAVTPGGEGLIHCNNSLLFLFSLLSCWSVMIHLQRVPDTWGQKGPIQENEWGPPDWAIYDLPGWNVLGGGGGDPTIVLHYRPKFGMWAALGAGDPDGARKISCMEGVLSVG